jgi:molybdopterin synthase sulfur carrier subunit
MAVVKLRAPLKDRAGGISDHELPGASVGEVLTELARRYPTVEGWILDEQGRVRPHVNVFVDGERTAEDTPLAPDAVVRVLPSISGGSSA